MSFWGAIGAAAGQLLGGVVQRDENIKSRKSNEAQSAADRALQREFAQNSIQWKVKDAEMAGIHPLAALGAQGYSASPTAIGVGPDTSMGDAISNMGQSVGRAFSSMQNKRQREINELMQVEALRNAQLKNKLLESQITSVNKTNNPGLPSNSGLPGSLTSSGQGDAYVLEKPLQRVHSAKGRPSQEVGHVPDVGFARTSSGLAPVPSQDVKERIEDQLIPELSWAIRNQLLPNFGKGEKPSRELLPSWADNWRWSFKKQEWQPYKYEKVDKLYRRMFNEDFW